MKYFKSDYLSDIDIKSSSLIIDDFQIDPDLSLEEQESLLASDIIYLISFKDGKPITVDVGWNPEFEKDGQFQIMVAINYDWQNPIYKKYCKDVKTMKKYFQEAIDVADEMYRTPHAQS